MKILVIEDDKTTGAYIADGLRQEGHVVDLIDNGADGLVQATVGTYDVIVIDRMLPGLDGLSVVKTLRGARNLSPVLLLTALGGVNDRIEGLNAGLTTTLSNPSHLASFRPASTPLAAAHRCRTHP